MAVGLGGERVGPWLVDQDAEALVPELRVYIQRLGLEGELPFERARAKDLAVVGLDHQCQHLAL